MGRRSTIWRRKGRGLWTTINREQHYLGPDLKSARKEFDRLLARSPTQHGRHTITQLVVLYLQHVKPTIAPKTYAGYVATLEMWVEDTSQHKPHELRAYHLLEWLAAHKTWNDSTKHTYAARIKRWSSFCEAWGYTDADKLRSASVPDGDPREAADPATLARLDREITCPALSDIYRFLYDVGCRPGEAITLEARAVNRATSTAIVTGKTGERVVGLSPRALEIVARRSLVFPEGPVFRNARDGNPWTIVNLSHRLTKWCKRLRVEHVVPYALRHALYCRWYDSGIADIIIAKQLGHISHGVPHLKLLKSTYAHAEGRHLADAAAMVGSTELPRLNRRQRGTQ